MVVCRRYETLRRVLELIQSRTVVNEADSTLARIPPALVLNTDNNITGWYMLTQLCHHWGELYHTVQLALRIITY